MTSLIAEQATVRQKQGNRCTVAFLFFFCLFFKKDTPVQCRLVTRLFGKPLKYVKHCPGFKEKRTSAHYVVTQTQAEIVNNPMETRGL